MTKTFWDTEIEVDMIEISDKKRIIIKHVTKDEKKFVDVRQYFMKGKEWQHGKGIAIPYEVAKGVGNLITKSIIEDGDELIFEGVE